MYCLDPSPLPFGLYKDKSKLAYLVLILLLVYLIKSEDLLDQSLGAWDRAVR